MNALDQAFACAAPPISEPELQKRLARVSHQLERVRQEESQLLGIESEAKKKLAAIAKELEKERSSLQWVASSPHRIGYRQMSMEPLSWRDKHGYPRIVPFSIDSPEFKIHVSKEKYGLSIEAKGFGWSAKGLLVAGIASAFFGYYWKGKATPENFESVEGSTMVMYIFAVLLLLRGTFLFAVSRHFLAKKRKQEREEIFPLLPEPLAHCFNDVRSLFERELEKKWLGSKTIGVTYAGVIPAPVRDNIRKAKKNFKDVFILAEPGDWNVAEVLIDPLVVGWDGSSLWLVDKYDTTPTEDYISQEFTS
ncbi:MAG: hypothetical protein AAB407_03650 [Patescibacteria group bacterium]